jgi:hypothetical protein
MNQILNLYSYLVTLQNGFIKAFNYSVIESVESYSSGSDYYIKISFVSDKGCPQDPLTIKLGTVANQPTWTNSASGANVAVNDILSWAQSSTSTSGLATESTLQDVKNILTPGARIPGLIRTSGAGNFPTSVYDISFTNVGLSDGLLLGTVIKPNETIEYGAGAVSNFYLANVFSFDATGTEFLIAYNEM